MSSFSGSHSEWNLGSPGGWDYQRTTQEIYRVVWQKINQISPTGVDLDFDDPLLHPVVGFSRMMANAMKKREGSTPGAIAIVAEEETLADVTENINIAKQLDKIDGITGILSAPHEFEIRKGRVCHQGRPVSLMFTDFNNDVLLNLHRKHDLSPLLQAVAENRVINPRGTEPINIKSMFEVITGENNHPFHTEIIKRTPWTRRFFERKTIGPEGQVINDLIEWTKQNWHDLVLKPERGYSGMGVRVGEVNPDGDDAIELALKKGKYIVQQKVPLELWAEEIPEIDHDQKSIVLNRRQTDFRCLVGPDEVFGFLCRYGDVPTNVGSGGGFQPLAILRSDMTVKDAVDRINQAILKMSYKDICAIENIQKTMAIEEKFTYLLGPIKIALRPRIVTPLQIKDLKVYSRAVWSDSLTLEKMWHQGQLDDYIYIEEDELEIARLQPWKGSPAILAADGLFSFGAHLEAR